MAADAETMPRTVTVSKGLVDALDRIMQELIRTPKFKEIVVVVLNSIDPPAARGLVRTLFWGDPGLLMSVMGSLPALVNLAAEALAEVAAQMNAMPAPLLREFLDRMVAGIDGATAGEAAGGLVGMALSLGLSDQEGGLARSLSRLGEDFGRGYREAVGETTVSSRLESWMAGIAAKAMDEGSATHAFIREAARAVEKNPDFTKHVLMPVLSPILESAAGSRGEAAAKRPAKKSAAAKQPARKEAPKGASAPKKAAKPKPRGKE